MKVAAKPGVEPCAICGRKDLPLFQDHDHVSNFDRGKLCLNCNTGLGHLGDSAKRLHAAAAYLDHWNANPSGKPHSQPKAAGVEYRNGVRHAVAYAKAFGRAKLAEYACKRMLPWKAVASEFKAGVVDTAITLIQ